MRGCHQEITLQFDRTSVKILLITVQALDCSSQKMADMVQDIQAFGRAI